MSATTELIYRDGDFEATLARGTDEIAKIHDFITGAEKRMSVKATHRGGIRWGGRPAGGNTLSYSENRAEIRGVDGGYVTKREELFPAILGATRELLKVN